MGRPFSSRVGPGGRPRTLEEMATHIESKAVADGECLIWTGNTNRKGYGNTTWNGRYVQVHRLVYMARVGEIPDGLVVDHTCHNADPACAGGDTCVHRRCVAAAHLQAVTGLVNKQRSPLTHKARCKHDHPMTPENTYVFPNNGRRGCQTCRRDQRAASARRRRALRAGEIGPIRRRVDLEPMPETAPIHEPAPEPARVPERPLEPAR